MNAAPHRIVRSADLGGARRGLDQLLGLAAAIPLVFCAALAGLTSPIPAFVIRTAAVIWAACLLAFFAGVRRGLTFSEAGGAKGRELGTMLALFAFAVVSLFTCSPAVAAIGLGFVGLLDYLAARRAEAPAYFAVFRPLQMSVCAAALAFIQLVAT